MMAVRAPQQEDGPVFLLPLLLLLVLVISVVGNTCGCYGTNKVYVHYKPPVSGWFILYPGHRFQFQRVYHVRTPHPQKHHFLLRYIRQGSNWFLLEKKDPKKKPKVLSNNRKASNRIVVSCPSQCSCQELKVHGSSCWTINGFYEKYSTNNQDPRNFTITRPHDNKAKRSQCLLAYLGECLDNKINTYVEDVCRNYTKPLNDSKLLVKKEHYVHTHNYYNVTRDPNHDFWLIESDSSVFAVSRNTGPCPDQLTPDSTSWLRTDYNFTENIAVTCTKWDTLSGD